MQLFPFFMPPAASAPLVDKNQWSTISMLNTYPYLRDSHALASDVHSNGKIAVVGWANNNYDNQISEIVVYDNEGRKSFELQLSEFGYQALTGVKFSADGASLYVAGWVIETVGPWYTYEFSGKLNLSTGALTWKRIGIYNNIANKGMAIDSSENVYTVSESNQTPHGAVLIKRNSSGVLQWVRKYTWSNNTFPSCIATDNAGNVYIAGNFIKNGGTGLYNGFLIKVDSSGNIVWQKEITISPNVTYINGISIDSSNNIYLCGYCPLTFFNATVIKYNSSGTMQWQRFFGDVSEQFLGITTDTSGNVYLTGYATIGLQRFIVVSYDTNGTLRYQNKLADTHEGNGMGIAWDPRGYIIAVGRTTLGGYERFTVFRTKDDNSGSGANIWYGNFNYAPISLSSSAGTLTDGAGVLTSNTISLTNDLNDTVTIARSLTISNTF